MEEPMARPRWKAEITYRDKYRDETEEETEEETEDGTEPVIVYFDEIADLRDIVEAKISGNWNLIYQIVITQDTLISRMARRMKELLSESADPEEDMREVARNLEEDLYLDADTRSQEKFIRSLFWEDPMARRLEELALKYRVTPESAESPVDMVHSLTVGVNKGHLE
jgi:hypothetical protein